MNQETKNKMAEMLAAQQAKLTGIKSTPLPQIKKEIEIPAPIPEPEKQAENVPEMSNTTIADLLGDQEPVKNSNELKCIDYSEKAFAIIGEGTRAIKEQLMQLGGKYNAYLKCGKGYIFSKKRYDLVKQYLAI